MARAGIEPATFHFSGERCYQLSYLAVRGKPATPTGLEPATSAVTGRRANQLRYGALFKDLPACQRAFETIAARRRRAPLLLRIPNQIRTGATALKGRGPGPLDDGDQHKA